MIQRNRHLDDLIEPMRTMTYVFLSKLTEARIPVMIIETLRTEEQHEEDVANGRSWVKHSKHQDGLAIDICPFEEYQLNGSNKLEWDANNPIWQRIGDIGESVGLHWGGRWAVKDMGHFEI